MRVVMAKARGDEALVRLAHLAGRGEAQERLCEVLAGLRFLHWRSRAFAVFIAATSAFDPEPHLETTWMALVNGTLSGWRGSRRRRETARASGVGTEGTKTVNCPSSCSSMMKPGTSASSISTSAGFHALSRLSPDICWARPLNTARSEERRVAKEC